MSSTNYHGNKYDVLCLTSRKFGQIWLTSGVAAAVARDAQCSTARECKSKKG